MKESKDGCLPIESSESTSLLSRALLHALENNDKRAVIILKHLQSGDLTTNQQITINEIFEASVDGLPVELLVSIKNVLQLQQISEKDVKALADYFLVSKRTSRLITHKHVANGFVRAAFLVPSHLQKPLLDVAALSFNRPNDPTLPSALSSLAEASTSLKTHFALKPLLQASKDRDTAPLAISLISRFLQDPEQIDQMLRMSRWGPFGVLYEIASLHAELRKDVLDSYIKVLKNSYDGKLTTADLSRFRARIVEELVVIMSFDDESAEQVMDWTMSTDSEGVLDGELVSDL